MSANSVTSRKACLYFLSFIVALLFGISESSAQSIPYVETCTIRYRYDAAGNRVKREFKCVVPDIYNPGPPVVAEPRGGISVVYPNPTTGVINVSFSELVSNAEFTIFSVSGSIIQTYTLTQPSVLVTFDLSAQVPGTYFITVSALNTVETHEIIKMQ